MCFPDSHGASSVIYYNGLPDYAEMQFMKRYLLPGDNFIDIGANIGIYTLFTASLVRQTGCIESFEAIPATALKLKQQTKLNNLSNVNIHEVAVSSKNGTAEFELTRDDCTAHLATGEYVNPEQSIRTVKLDDFLSQQTSYAMGKMDIEGAEILALQGASNMLKDANPPVWQLELAGYSKRYGYQSNQVLDFLRRYNFHCAIYDVEEEKIRFTDQPWKYGAENVLMIHDRNRKSVRGIPVLFAGTYCQACHHD